YLDNDSARFAIDSAFVDSASFDACGIDIWQLSQSHFTCADVGSNLVTYTITDYNGNTNTCQTNVIVVDTTKPAIYCYVDTTIWLDDIGDFTINTNFLDSVSSDSCGIFSKTLDITDFSCADVGSNTVTLTIVDVNGNTSTCQTEVIVVDSIKPEIYCFVDTVIWLDALGDFTINTNFIDSSTTEACGIQSAVIDITDFSCSDIGN